MSNKSLSVANNHSCALSIATAKSKVRRVLAAGALSLLAVASATHAFAQAVEAKFVPFNDFIEQTRSVTSDEMLRRPEAQVKAAANLEEMRQAILDRYKDVQVSHSFLLDGQHYDCVPIEQQPAFRTYGINKAAQAPPLAMLKHASTSGTSSLESLSGKAEPLSLHVAGEALPEQFDSFGNPARCSENHVPLLRITLDQMSHFSSLQQFYQKTPGQAVKTAQARVVDPAVSSHKYSFTYQYVNNHGGNSSLNVWSPYVNTSRGEVFSLSQQWYIGGSGNGTQTEEVGWVVFPAMFGGDEKAHFFIFSTADNYATGCWNNSCNDFVQVADSGLLGNSFSNYSTYGGAQYEFNAQYYLYQGNWWLAYGSTWVGYYPGAKYKGGQNTRYAQIVEYGTEGVGTTLWPPEGSGLFSNWGWSYAAYQRNLYYINTANQGIWESLTPDQPSPACYSITGPYTSTGAWTKYFYEGGPGGTGC